MSDWSDIVDELKHNKKPPQKPRRLTSNAGSDMDLVMAALEAAIAVDLAKGFTHDVYWDDELGDVVIGPLLDDRGLSPNSQVVMVLTLPVQ